MSFSKNAVWTGGVVGLALAAGYCGLSGHDVLAAQQNTTQQNTPQQNTAQQGVPDAPRPQTLPNLKTVSPVAPALPDVPRPAAEVNQPNAPSAQVSTPGADPDQGAPPELPSANEASQVLKLRAPDVNFVNVPFTVKDSKGQLVPGITWRDVRVYENGLRQRQAVFIVDPTPLSVALVIDQSVTFDTMTKINNSLSALQGAFSAYDEVAVFTYNNGVREQTSFTAAQSARLGAVLQRSKVVGREPNLSMNSGLDQTLMKNNQIVDVNTTPVRGRTSIYQQPEKEYHTLNDAILAAAQATTKASKGRRRVVYVISDGKEYGSKATQKQVIQFLQGNEISVYATLVGDTAIPGLGFLDRIHLPYTMRDDVLPRYADATGGQCDPEFRQHGIEQSFAKISEQVRTQYIIGYYSREPFIDGKFRTVEVKVMRSGLNVIAKKGYYPTPRTSAPVPVTPSATP